MPSRYTKIPRAISEFKAYLDYNYQSYNDASEHIKPGEGWVIPYHSDYLFMIADNLEGNLYEGIYPKLTDENPASDKDILESFNGALNLFKSYTWVFDSILQYKKSAGDEVVLSTAEGIVYELLLKAIYKLQEVILLAGEDLAASRKRKLKPHVESTGDDENSLYKIGIIAATFQEFFEIKNRLKNVKELAPSDSDGQIYYAGEIKKGEKSIKVILVQCHHQGTAAASTTTTKLILKYKPSYVVMLGHAAGNKKLFNVLNLGDILICTESIDYDQVTVIECGDSGKPPIIKEKDRKVPVPADSTLIMRLQHFASDQQILDNIKSSFVNNAIFLPPLSFKVGKLLSGDALVRSEAWFERLINDNSGAIGLDMETYGVYYSAQHTLSGNRPKFISIKSVSDFGSHKKDFPKGLENPSIRVDYALHTSVEFFIKFVIDKIL